MCDKWHSPTLISINQNLSMNSDVRLMFLFLVIYRWISCTLYTEYDSDQQCQTCQNCLMTKMSITLSALILISLQISCKKILQTHSVSKTLKLLLLLTFKFALHTWQILFSSAVLYHEFVKRMNFICCNECMWLR